MGVVTAPRVLGGVFLCACATLTACAALMGVDEPTLGTPFVEAGSEPTPIDGASLGANDQACRVDADCTDPANRKCVAGACMECTTTPDSCPAGRYCVTGTPGAPNQCAPGCNTDDDCKALSPAAPYCVSGRHQCVACRDKSDCPNAGQDCSPSGTCADTCQSEGGTCRVATENCCAGFCVDTTSDVLNCNGCGLACDGTNPLCCGGACKKSLTDPANCGQCGFACSGAQGTPQCHAGSCQWNCDPGYDHCSTGNTGCETGTASSVTQCGGCTNDCNATVKNAGNVGCSGSKCTFATCNSGFADCDKVASNGCECACGQHDQPCCGGSSCGANLYCGSDQSCHSCRNKNESCDDSNECCSGLTCGPSHMCK